MADADAAAAGCCGLCVLSALEPWCFTHAFGADIRCGGGPRGCCGNCCDSAFNEDDLDERMKKQQAKNDDKPEPVQSQPAPSDGMSAAASDPKPADAAA